MGRKVVVAVTEGGRETAAPWGASPALTERDLCSTMGASPELHRELDWFWVRHGFKPPSSPAKPAPRRGREHFRTKYQTTRSGASVDRHGSQWIECNLQFPSTAVLPDLAIVPNGPRQEQTAV